MKIGSDIVNFLVFYKHDDEGEKDMRVRSETRVCNRVE
jgi:hypothetical protein